MLKMEQNYFKRIQFLSNIIINMLQLDWLVYTILTVFIPFKFTFTALKQKEGENRLNLWSSYWAIYLLLNLAQCFLPLLSYQPIKLGLLLFHLWLYSEDYQGALLLSALAKKKISALGFQGYIKVVAQHLKLLNVFDAEESDQRQQVVPEQSKKQQ